MTYSHSTSCEEQQRPFDLTLTSSLFETQEKLSERDKLEITPRICCRGCNKQLKMGIHDAYGNRPGENSGPGENSAPRARSALHPPSPASSRHRGAETGARAAPAAGGPGSGCAARRVPAEGAGRGAGWRSFRAFASVAGRSGCAVGSRVSLPPSLLPLSSWLPRAMLLPSDVARLVLGYLQQEKLLATCREFILESSDLKEYAEHCTEDGFIPACLLSLCGKNLTTILNEYVAMKTKETTNEVPAMMSSLWKKLDYTLSQIRSMQNSTGFSANQRTRTRSGIVEMKRQRMLQQSAPANSGLLSVAHQSGPQNSASVVPPQVIHRPTINQSVSQARLNTLLVHHSQAQENKMNTGDFIHIQVPSSQERKLHSNLLSPGRRKSESQKRKNIVASGPLSATRNSQDPDEAITEKESEPLEEFIDGNFPKLSLEDKFIVLYLN
ncbi:protein NPAT-like [Heliangelus exortis]|uniref:protein NPAT-like n=1 Tax=Heliangelus exortis TaxID=472823 RepID=UPI003A905F7B